MIVRERISGGTEPLCHIGDLWHRSSVQEQYRECIWPRAQLPHFWNHSWICIEDMPFMVSISHCLRMARILGQLHSWETQSSLWQLTLAWRLFSSLAEVLDCIAVWKASTQFICHLLFFCLNPHLLLGGQWIDSLTCTSWFSIVFVLNYVWGRTLSSIWCFGPLSVLIWCCLYLYFSQCSICVSKVQPGLKINALEELQISMAVKIQSCNYSQS